MPISVKVEDRRTIQCAIPANKTDTMEFATACGNAATHGYILKSAGEITGGSQRDPYVVGVRLIFEKP